MYLKPLVLKKLLGIFLLFHSSVVAAEMIQPSHMQVLQNGKEKDLSVAISKFKQAMKKQSNNSAGYYEIYQAYIEQIGVKRIREFLHEQNPACHGIAHSLGKVIAEKASDLNSGMRLCSDTCTYGCVHGVFKVYFSRLGEDYQIHNHTHKTHKPMSLNNSAIQQFSQDVNLACEHSEAIVEDFFKGNCAHGVGHAVAKISDNAKQASALCKVFAQAVMQYYCETGVFMELASFLKAEVYKDETRRSQKTKLALPYCEENSFYPSACLRFLLPRNRSLGQITRYGSICAQQNQKMKQHCFNAMGYHSRTYVAKNPEEMRYVCSLANSAGAQQACISGLAFMKKGQRFRGDIQQACVHLHSEAFVTLCRSQSKHYYYDLANQNFAEIL